MQRLINIKIIVFIVCLSISCSCKGLDDHNSEHDHLIEEEEMSVDSIPNADTEDWFYRKNKFTSKNEKYFGIGLWHVSGYTLSENDYADETYKNDFKERTGSSNIVIIDEIALGGVAKWFIPPVIGDKMYESIKKRETNPIVLVDLMGHGRGSTFFFEQNYLKTHASMPVKPPYDLLSEGTNAQKTYPLLGFSQAYDGTPVYKFDDNGNYSYENLYLETLKSKWYENVRQIASAYQKNGNVFSINAFRDFYAHPILAGVTTDAMQEGLKDKPIWLYFDGNGYAKPANVTPENYVKNVKYQIYTSIVHGATGIFFWNDW